HYTPADVDRFAVVSGPGGFTGLRVGIATIQGLALVGHRQVFAASTLLLLAVAARQAAASSAGQPPLVGAWMHATRGEVFTALYRPFDSTHPSTALGATLSLSPLDATIMARVGLVAIEDASVGAPGEVAARWRSVAPSSARLFLMGDATGELAEPLRQQFGDAVELQAPPALAGVLATLAAALPDLAVPPHAIVPTYVRRPDAELARDRMTSLPGSRA
ncbi:MAG: tRNA (adenosine(37)-N6)-threonylcarbamoyltransferase complex dimerization subunit type 1 TsaB, partial [Vicinamibacteraceae bacterium]